MKPSRSAVLGLIAVMLAACQPSPPTADINAQMTQAVNTALASIQGTQTASTPAATGTSVPTATAVRTPPSLASTFNTSILDGIATPHTYMQDTCEYLKDKWTSTNSPPGTVVMVIMIHGVTKGQPDKPQDMNMQDFNRLINDLHDAGFQGIFTQELADFLYSNAKIPQRSVLLIQDDRHHAENFNDHFRQYWEQWGWPIVSGWISVDGPNDPYLPENVPLSQEGWVDYQAHGVVHNIPMSDSSSDDYLTGELQGSMTNIEQVFHKTPIAIIWPGGGFGLRPVQFARKFGFQLGFTTNSRGPLMYNWIPLADQLDAGHPLEIAEGPVNDPLMVLPRFRDTNAGSYIDEVRQIGTEAAAYAETQKASELEYYDIVCAADYGPMP